MDDLDMLSQMADPMEGRSAPPGYEDYGSMSGGSGYPGAYSGAGSNSASSYYCGGGPANIGVRVEPQMINGRLAIKMPQPPPPSKTQPLMDNIATTRDVAIQIEEDTVLIEAEAPASTNRGTRTFVAIFAVTFFIVVPVSFFAAKRFL